MEILGVGSNELIVILLLAAIVLGPERMARAARELGKFIRNLKNYFNSLSDELKNELDMLDEVKKVNDDLKNFKS
ncbi:MAG: Sec-independent protein translocase subunit TatA/TatB [Anaerolineales bacterium]